ncbi:MAG: Maf family protein [Kangiellaceae bacterium]|jgi:septum formation protein|nr:Maf family protein [Kangiellaceae bacterium]
MKLLSFNKLCLASRSPRRQQLLEQIGVDFVTEPANIDESMLANELSDDFVQRLAISKAQAIWNKKSYSRKYPVLGSDTIVVSQSQVLGQPRDRADGIAMLQSLSASTHSVLTAVALVFSDKIDCAISKSTVTFRAITAAEIADYWSTGEGHDKAGCYAVQGKAASFIENINGSFSGVMGLPLFETCQLLDRWNIHYWMSDKS